MPSGQSGGISAFCGGIFQNGVTSAWRRCTKVLYPNITATKLPTGIEFTISSNSIGGSSTGTWSLETKKPPEMLIFLLTHRLKFASSLFHGISAMSTFCHFKIATLAWRWIKRFAKMNHNKQTSNAGFLVNPNQTFSDFLCRCLCSFLLSSFFLLCFSFLGLKWDFMGPASLVNVAYGISSLSRCASASRRFLAWQVLWNHRPGGSIWRSLADLKFAFDRVWNLQQDTKYVLAGSSTLPTKTRDVKNIRNMMPIYQQVNSLMPLLLSPPSLWPLSLLFPWPL